MEKENRRKNKITPFPSQKKREENREWKEYFKRQLRREAQELEAELEEKPELKDIDASPELFERIVEQLRNEGKWEEEIAEELAPDIRFLLSEKDREALDIGRSIQKQGRRRTRGKWIGRIAAVVLCAFLVTLSSEANREYVVGVINKITGSKWGVYVEDVSNDTVKYSEDEREAFKDIEEQLEILVPQMQYRPYGMEFQSYQVSKGGKRGMVFYQYGENLVTMYLYGQIKDATMQQTLEAKVVDEVQIDVLELSAKLYELEDTTGDAYAGEIVYNDCYYLILGKMDKDEFKKMLQNIIF